MPCWYYDKKDIKNSPSSRDGIDAATEARYRREGARFILDAGSKLGLRYDTCATGVAYFHRFFMFHSFKEFHRYVMGACCLFLAGKSEETPKKAKDIIRTCQQLISPQLFVIFGEDPREEIITMERILLQTIKFDLKVDHPYAFLLRLAKKLKGDKDKIQKMAQMAWTFINDSLCTTLCLQWEAEITAVSLMYLASRLTKFDVVDWEGRPSGCKLKWWEFFLEDLSMELMEDICHQVLDLYSAKGSKQEESPPISPAARQQNQQRQLTQHANSPQPTPSANKRSRPVSTAESKKITPSDATSAHQYQQQPDSKRPRRSQPPPPDQRSNGADKQQQRRVPHTELPPPPPPPPQPGSSSYPKHLPSPLTRSSSSSGGSNNTATTTTCATSDFSMQNPYVASGMFSSSFMNKEGSQSIQSLISQSGKVPATHSQYPPGYSSVTTAPPMHPPHPYSQPPPYHPQTNYPPPLNTYTTTTGYPPPSMPPPPPVQAPPPPGGFAPPYNYPPPPPFPPTSQPPPGFPSYPPLPPGNMPPPPLPTSNYPPPPPMYPPPPPGNYPPPPSQPPLPRSAPPLPGGSHENAHTSLSSGKPQVRITGRNNR